jgi:hypothetical protein
VVIKIRSWRSSGSWEERTNWYRIECPLHAYSCLDLVVHSRLVQSYEGACHEFLYYTYESILYCEVTNTQTLITYTHSCSYTHTSTTHNIILLYNIMFSLDLSHSIYKHTLYSNTGTPVLSCLGKGTAHFCVVFIPLLSILSKYYSKYIIRTHTTHTKPWMHSLQMLSCSRYSYTEGVDFP